MANVKKCPKCNSTDTVWRGYRCNKSGKKRLRKCNDCGCKFTPNDGFLRMRVPKEFVIEAVSLYVDGLSLGRVKKHLWQHHGIKVSRWTILQWAGKYAKMLGKFTDKLKPRIKGNIHADEVIVKVKGKNNWSWGAIDKKTKYKFSGPLTKRRVKEGAAELFRALRDRAENAPEKIITDKLGHYRFAHRRIFYEKPGPELVHGVPIGCRKHGLEHNNNPIERDNGRIKQRYKVMRGFKENGSAGDILKLLDIDHNFVNPHMGLQGSTPAEAADIELRLGRNKMLWLVFLLAF